ncbi:MAG: TonB-dependent receptor [Prevotellaceae bacterium]|jgi:TonB-linked SusC/RagA family outer membrane protein|nr:TonB-dependent receptor [Prevotellaceae bacterium]
MIKHFKLIFLFCALPIMVFAQNIKISGVVTDQYGEFLTGVAVVEKGTANGTITDINGAFEISVKNDAAVLVFTMVSYKTQEIKAGTKTELRVTMQDISNELDEVVAVGYGTMRKRDISGAIQQVKGDDLLKGNPSTSISSALQGKMAGVVVAQNDGAPGAGMSITIRGTNSFSTSSQPLYVVDGIPFDVAGMPSGGDANGANNQTANPLALINPSNIESIEVLKDASATAIYGSRGANGVVLITTKKGAEGNEKVELSANVSMSQIGKQVKVLNGYDYANYMNEQAIFDETYRGKTYTNLPFSGLWAYNYDANDNVMPSTFRYTPSPEDFLHPYTIYDAYGNSFTPEQTDWQDQIYQTGLTQEYNLRVSGGNNNGWHSFSGNFVNQDGIIKNSGYRRYNVAANIGRKVHKWLELGLSINYTNSTTNFTKSNAYDFSIIRSALWFPPTYGVDMETTTADNLSWLAANPYKYINTAFDKLVTDNVFTSAYAEIKFTDYLSFRQNVGISYSSNNRMTYYGRHTQEGRAPNNGVGSQADNWWRGITIESLLTFKKTFGIHSLNAVVGFTRENGDWGSKSIVSRNFPSDETGAFDLSKGLEPQTPTSDRGMSRMNSVLGRINYVLSDKYIFTVSFRSDGTSKFAKGNRWEHSPSAAFAWRASEEKFIQKLNIFSNLKLRLSYGQTGNQGINAYATIMQLGRANYPYDGSLNSGYAQLLWAGPVNKNLKWETTEQYNAGLDVSFLRDRINFTIDYYHKNTRDLLQRVKIPTSAGFGSMQTNFGNVTNDGLEITGNFGLIQNRDFKWNLSANISFNKNKIHGLEQDQFANALWSAVDEVFIQRNDCPIGAIYGYVEDGFYDNEAEVRADKTYANSAEATIKNMVGEIKYRDISGPDGVPDGIVDSYDRTIIGNTNPDFVYGLTTSISWKGLNLSIFFQGTYGNDMFNANLVDIKMGNQGNITQEAYDTRWRPDFTDADGAMWPKATGGYDRVWKTSNRYVEDGSYLRLKNISLSYDIPVKIKAIETLNIFASASNLFTITKYSWFDPDVNAFGGDASRRGVDIYSYPSSRNYSLGVKIIF